MCVNLRDAVCVYYNNLNYYLIIILILVIIFYYYEMKYYENGGTKEIVKFKVFNIGNDDDSVFKTKT